MFYYSLKDEDKKIVEVWTDDLNAAKEFELSLETEDRPIAGGDGNYYLKGYVPEKPQSEIDEERIRELQQYLNDTDWYVARYSETGIEIPEEVKQKRKEAREEISKLRTKGE